MRRRSNPDYSGEHAAPNRESGVPLHDVTGTYPDDIYGPMAARYYGHYGDSRDNAAISVIQSFRGRPNATLTIYRAVPYEMTVDEQIEQIRGYLRKLMARCISPNGTKLSTKECSNMYSEYSSQVEKLEALPRNAMVVYPINVGDWVTTVRSYAKEHGEGALRGQYKIVSKKVKAKDVFTNGDSIFEFGYDPA